MGNVPHGSFEASWTFLEAFLRANRSPGRDNPFEPSRGCVIGAYNLRFKGTGFPTSIDLPLSSGNPSS